jgi:hypothetical protein
MDRGHEGEARLDAGTCEGLLDRLLKDAGTTRDEGLALKISHRDRAFAGQGVLPGQRTDCIDREEWFGLDASVAGS